MIALIGEKGIWRGFSNLGVNIIEVETKEEVLKYINEILNSNYKLLFLSDFAAKLIEKSLDELYSQTKLNIVLLPDIYNSDKDFINNLYYKRLREITQKAIGIDIL